MFQNATVSYATPLDQPEAMQLIAKLRKLGIDTLSAPFPQNYEKALRHFEALRSSAILITINLDTHLEPLIAYAMLLQKPIVTLQNEGHRGGHLYEIINSRFHKVYLFNLMMLESSDINNLIPHLAKDKVNYNLTNHEKTLIRAYLRAYFRSLLVIR